MARCLLKSKRMPPRFWEEAVVAAVFILNRAPTKSLHNMTPFEAWHGKKATVDHLKTFGCIPHVKAVGPGITKLCDRSTETVFLGYESGTKGYRLVDPVNNQLHVSLDVVFEEKEMWIGIPQAVVAVLTIQVPADSVTGGH